MLVLQKSNLRPWCATPKKSPSVGVNDKRRVESISSAWPPDSRGDILLWIRTTSRYTRAKKRELVQIQLIWGGHRRSSPAAVTSCPFQALKAELQRPQRRTFREYKPKQKSHIWAPPAGPATCGWCNSTPSPATVIPNLCWGKNMKLRFGVASSFSSISTQQCINATGIKFVHTCDLGKNGFK